MLLTVLGTATPYPQPGNACSGYLVQSGGPLSVAKDAPNRATVWVDAGTGTLAELQRHTRLADLDAIWISHRHADHTADLLVAYYALRFSELAPAGPVRLIGPEGLLDRLAAFLGPNAAALLPEVFDFTPMSGWGETEVGPLALAWGPVQHGVPAFGLTVAENGRRLAYSGDSAPCISLEELAEDADLLLIEAGYAEAPAGSETAEAPAHHTTEDAGRTASRARAARLVLTHIANEVTPAVAVSRASAHFDGPLEAAAPGSVYEI